MALRQLMINKKIQQRKAILEELTLQQEGFITRAAELEKAIDEAETEEEIKTVEDEIEKLDEEKAAVEEEKGKLESEITGLEIELKEIDEKEPVNKESLETNKEAEGEIEMRKKGIFGNMKREKIKKLMEREDIKEFLVRTRELIEQKRSVTGTELLIPNILVDILRDNLHMYSKLITKVNIKTIKGKARQNIAGSIPEAIWTEAVGTLNELSLSFNQIEVDGYKVGGYIPVPNSYLEDSDINLANEIMESLGKAIGYAVDKAIIYGTSNKMPLGIVTRLAQAERPSNLSSNAPAWKNLRSNLIKLDAAAKNGTEFFAALLLSLSKAKANYSNGSKFWAMNSKTKAQIMAKAITFNAAGAIVAAANDTMPILGGDIVELEFMADNDIVGGYGSLYLLAERAGTKIEVSDQVKFLDDITVFKGTSRYDGCPSIGEGFVAVNIANSEITTTVPFSADEANIEDVYLKDVKIGALSLSPNFEGAVTTYKTTTTDATNKISIETLNPKAAAEIKVNNKVIENGEAATWTTGENKVIVTVKHGTTTEKVYTITVTK